MCVSVGVLCVSHVCGVCGTCMLRQIQSVDSDDKHMGFTYDLPAAFGQMFSWLPAASGPMDVSKISGSSL